MVLGLLASAVLVQSCHSGLRLMPDTMTSVRQRDGCHQYTNGYLASAQWCSHDLRVCTDAWEHPQCPIDECTHVWLVYAPVDQDTVVISTPGLPVTFHAVSPGGAVDSGAWAGPADWSLDGRIDSADLFAFLTAFFQGDADHNMDGLTNSSDFFLFIADFFG